MDGGEWNMVKIRLFIKLFLKKHFDLNSFCKKCGRTVHDFDAPNDVWKKIEPFIKHGNVLCYDYFCEMCKQNNLPSVWKLNKI